MEDVCENISKVFKLSLIATIRWINVNEINNEYNINI